MKIINVSNFSVFRLKNCYMNDIILKISNGFIRKGHHVINYSDRDVSRYFSFTRSLSKNNSKLQKHFIDFCTKVKPDIILLCHADTINEDTLKIIKGILPKTKIAQYNLDIIRPGTKESDKNIKKIKSKLKVVDNTFITTGDESLLEQFRCNGKYNVNFMPNPVDKSLETAQSYLIEKPKYDLIYGATETKREFFNNLLSCDEIVNFIEDNVPNLKLKVFGFNKKNKIEGALYQELHSSAAMGLNLSRINNCNLYSSDRMAHIMGNGLLCIMDEASGFKEFFSDDEVCFYKDQEDLIYKLNYYKNNPLERMRVAKNGYNKYYSLFNEEKVVSYLIKEIFFLD